MLETQKSRVRLSDIAEAAHLSAAAVSMALSDHPGINPETKKRVRTLCRKFGYQRPGERVRNLEAKRVGFMVVGMSFKDEVLTSLLSGLSTQASARGLRMEISSIEEAHDPETVGKQILKFVSELDGLILEGIINNELLQKVANAQIPYVILGSILVGLGEAPPNVGHFVTHDCQSMGKLAAGRLMACGHRRVGFVCERIIPGLWNYKWLTGYTLGHEDAHLTPDPSLIHVDGRPYAGGEPAARYFSQMKDPPTAYVIPDIRIGNSFIHEMGKRGIEIPRESIILGGNLNVAKKYHMEAYPLICEDDELIGTTAMELLFQLYQNSGLPAAVMQIPFITRNLPEPPGPREH